MQDEVFMDEALKLAKEAAADGEVPVGCVIVRDGKIVGRGRNRREEKQSTASHAEMEAIAEAGIREITVNASSLFDTHSPMLKHINSGVVTNIAADYIHCDALIILSI